MKVSDVIKLVEKSGWVLDRQAGGHRQYIHPDKPGQLLTIPGAPYKEMPTGTFHKIIKQAGLK